MRGASRAVVSVFFNPRKDTGTKLMNERILSTQVQHSPYYFPDLVPRIPSLPRISLGFYLPTNLLCLSQYFPTVGKRMYISSLHGAIDCDTIYRAAVNMASKYHHERILTHQAHILACLAISPPLTLLLVFSQPLPSLINWDQVPIP